MYSKFISCNPNLMLIPESAQSVSDLTSRWNLTRDRHPPILPGQRAAFARMMDYVTAKGIFPGEIPYVIFKVWGVLVVILTGLRELILTLYSAQGRNRDPCRRASCRLRAHVS